MYCKQTAQRKMDSSILYTLVDYNCPYIADVHSTQQHTILTQKVIIILAQWTLFLYCQINSTMRECFLEMAIDLQNEVQTVENCRLKWYSLENDSHMILLNAQIVMKRQ